ncbi:peptidoglycan-binding protein [Aetokthonos hydrillicola Thurmond2011]|jgi:peptidoglycan hydrolase-like protein with peptidoglycan-binding domain|uniref:Peptidoglycan-binding protein n=1 Tax=Aetokthonos hydrillicola Thurmond2011 TaxID=2712845 RepID=A0AAP5MA70_9CYAN|nr:peptidoglycan-binding domain-containing protein [Aetokthonos hydrillicola]MBW4584469.1 peptidoglycan-binding protein [Aetokthonos hydrillicola CCALA 1050]MDR9896432.1 peptidoglycan-binding protein [Aetokthonos hydrillicola Thurmond2011]
MSTISSPILRPGSTGEDVKHLQHDLNIYGYHLAVDGIFGPKTEAAVKDFQKSHGLVVDGIVGPKTWAALEKR